MAQICKTCQRTFITLGGLVQHINRCHKHKKPTAPRSTFKYHPHLNARPCTEEGAFLPHHAAPPPPPTAEDWTPFVDRPSFEFAELTFEKMQPSKGNIDQLLRIWAAKNILDSADNVEPIFEDCQDLYNTIDAIPYGESAWHTFQVQYTGPVTAESPSWKRNKFTVHTRDTLTVAHNMAVSADFQDKFDFVPFEEYTAPNTRRWSNLMSGRWAWKKSDVIAQDPQLHGAMLVPVILGADKTTVSVATGNQEFHPVYMLLGNISNEMRRAHRDAIVPLAFLSIPKTAREHDNDDDFRLFKKQLYHASLAHILAPLRPGMTHPEIMKCPDGHFRCAIFELGPFIADYPEQVFLAGIVQGWCPKCQATPEELAGAGTPRFREHTEQMINAFDAETLWDVFGVVDDVVPFTNHFPRADIHELITPDLLHQVIKGTFKDHLVAWVEEYINMTAGSTREAKHIMDDIDRRIAAAPPFPGLRRFPEGRNFKQWTGNDSKALMKVFLPAIVGHVPDKMVMCVAAFLDFCYLAQRPAHDSATLQAMTDALERFHTHRIIFEEVGVRPDGFSLLRQHALVHYVLSIKLFGSPNGLCSSITESKHIVAVKRPWRRSNHNEPLGQIIRVNTRLSKLAAARIEFGRRGMLRGNVITHALIAVGRDAAVLDDDEVPDATVYVRKPPALADELHQPSLPELVRRFLHDQLYPNDVLAAINIPLKECPEFSGRIGVHNSASATFYAPSELSGPGGMHRELIRSNPTWYGQHARFDTILVQNGPDNGNMRNMLVGRVLRFLSFVYDNVRYPCALVEWLLVEGEHPDRLTGMWVVRPEMVHGKRTVGLVHLDCVVRACHLIGVYNRTYLPSDFHFSYSLDAFSAFYVNKYVDYHSHETIV
ncbi:hypothetical protein B0H21DRAFT_779117 [Amylocystis lapponica]|nr:hypothetical protein B0H21DRAFT_779117 [Amylocystis lapponica]